MIGQEPCAKKTAEDSNVEQGPLHFDTFEKDLAVNEAKAKACLIGFFQNLHGLIVKPQQSNRKVDIDEEFDSPHALDKLEELVASESSLLFDCICVLATGSTDILNRDNEILDRTRERLYLATENIKRATNPRGSALRAINGRIISNSNSTSHVTDLMSRLGVAHSRKSVNDESNKKVALAMREGAPIRGKRYHLLALLYDNIGLLSRIGYGDGQAKSYVQLTNMRCHFTVPRAIQKVGGYPNPDDENAPLLSWEKLNDWDLIRDTTARAEKILLPLAEDYENLAKSSFHCYEALLELIQSGKFPTVEEAREWSKSKLKHSCVYPDDLSKLKYSDKEVLLDLTDDDEIYHDTPIMKDLSKKETVEFLMKYTSVASEKLKDKENIEHYDPFWQKITPISEKMSTPFQGDGNPSRQAENIQEERKEKQRRMRTNLNGMSGEERAAADEDSSLSESESESEDEGDDNGEFDSDEYDWDNLLQKVLVLNGGFHSMLELYKKIGDVFGCTHLNQIVGLWRASAKAIQYIITPSDPSQAEEELENLHSAIFAAATHGLLSQRMENGNYDTNISVAQVHEHIEEKAGKSLLGHLVFLHMRCHEVIMAFRRAEVTGNAGLYNSCNKFALLIYINTNATNYVPMVCNQLIHRHCASEAENTIVDKLILFRKTKGGKLVYADRLVEWMIKRARRSGVGHFYNKSSEMKFLKHNLVTCNQQSEFMKPKTSTSKKSKIDFNASFLETFLYMIDSNVWHGEPKAVKMKKYVERCKTCATDDAELRMTADLHTPDGQTSLYPDCLFLISTGKDRVTEYFEKILTEQHANKSLPEVLKKLQDWARLSQAHLVHRRDFTKKLIEREINYQNTKVPPDKIIRIDARKHKREDLIKALCQLRVERERQDKSLFGAAWEEAAWIQRRTNEIKDWYNSMNENERNLGQRTKNGPNRKQKKKKKKIVMSKPRTLGHELAQLKKFSRMSEKQLEDDKDYTKKFANDELDFHNTYLNDCDEIYQPRATMSTREWAHLIEKIRNIRKEIDKREVGDENWTQEAWQERLDHQISNWYHKDDDENIESFNIRRQSELREKFYTFEGTDAKLRASQRYFNCSAFVPELEQAENETQDTQDEDNLSESDGDGLWFDVDEFEF